MGLVIGVGEIVGGVLSPLSAGALADQFGLSAPLMLAAAMPLVAAVLALGLLETNPRIVSRAAAQMA
jgi:fucose permease